MRCRLEFYSKQDKGQNNCHFYLLLLIGLNDGSGGRDRTYDQLINSQSAMSFLILFTSSHYQSCTFIYPYIYKGLNTGLLLSLRHEVCIISRNWSPTVKLICPLAVPQKKRDIKKELTELY